MRNKKIFFSIIIFLLCFIMFFVLKNNKTNIENISKSPTIDLVRKNDGLWIRVENSSLVKVGEDVNAPFFLDKKNMRVYFFIDNDSIIRYQIDQKNYSSGKIYFYKNMRCPTTMNK